MAWSRDVLGSTHIAKQLFYIYIFFNSVSFILVLMGWWGVGWVAGLNEIITNSAHSSICSLDMSNILNVAIMSLNHLFILLITFIPLIVKTTPFGTS